MTIISSPLILFLSDLTVLITNSAIKNAINYGLSHDLFGNFLSKYESEVANVLYDEFDIECMLYEPAEMQRCIEELRMMELC